MAKSHRNKVTKKNIQSSPEPQALTEDWVVQAFSAIAHDKRLAILRLLLRHAPGVLSAGEVARVFKIPPSTLSFHLSRLEHAGLVQSHRQQRNIYYQVDLMVIRQLAGFLLEECCRETKSKAQVAALLASARHEDEWKMNMSASAELN